MNIHISLLNSTDYFSVVFGGLFSLATIMIAVFSIVSGEIKKRTRGFSIIELHRYNVLLLLLPIYLVFILFFICSVFNLSDNLFFLVVCFFIVLVDITIQSIYILQPFYDINKIKGIVLNLYKNNFKKKLSKAVVDDDVIDILTQESKYTLECVSIENNSIFIELTLAEKIELFTYYIQIIHDKIISINIELECLIFDTGLLYLGDYFFSIVDDLNIDRKVLLIKILDLNENKHDTLFINKIIFLLQALYQENDISVLDELKIFHRQCLNDNKNLCALCEFLFNNDTWTYADSLFICEELSFLVRIRNMGLLEFKYLDSEKVQMINCVLDGFSQRKEIEIEDKKLSEKINMIINTLGVDKNDKE